MKSLTFIAALAYAVNPPQEGRGTAVSGAFHLSLDLSSGTGGAFLSPGGGPFRSRGGRIFLRSSFGVQSHFTRIRTISSVFF